VCVCVWCNVRDFTEGREKDAMEKVLVETAVC
jgi:hypothetical protein